MKKEVVVVIAIIVVLLGAAGIMSWRQRIASPALTNNNYGLNQSVNAPAEPLSVDLTPATPEDSNSTTPTKNNMHRITLETTLGKIVFETDDADAPNTVNNFITLANKGFYNGLIFHRVISGFMIQGGDPTGTGRGGPGYQFADELNPATESYKKGYVRGTVALANAGPNTNGSQFFIMQEDRPLSHDYTIFGQVIEGIEVVDKIVSVPTDDNDKPFQPIAMATVTVEEVK